MMSGVKLFWDPSGFNLDTLGSKELIKTVDGDTVSIALSIRMLSVDTPEIFYGGQTGAQHDQNLLQLGEWIKAGKAPIQDDLAEYLYPKLASGSAGSLQETHGKKASEYFKQLLQKKLTNDDGSQRKLFLRAANKPFDMYGRLLSYIAPYYSPDELSRMSSLERATFNLIMVESGWGASFPIYPSLPKYSDLVLLNDAAQSAYEAKLGIWADPLALTGYEFRMAVKLYDITKKMMKQKKLSSQERYSWISRFCADMSTQEIYYPQDYYKVKPYNRIFIWPEDINEAVGRLNLTPG